MSSLLRRVSDESADEEAPERPAEPLEAPIKRRLAAPLEEISETAAIAIAPDVYEDVWNRYNRGERQIFSRSLYTAEGQQTFDDVRRRYQRDREFRNVVDRYVDDFEHTMTEAAEADTSGRRSRGYLFSETGKLYTLLAHASGRLS